MPGHRFPLVAAGAASAAAGRDLLPKPARRCVAAFFAPLLIASCAPAATVDERGRTVEHHFGYVRIVKPPGIGGGADFSAEGVETYGVRVAGGVTLGYTDTQRISVPLDCRVLAVVRDRAQLDHLIEMLNLAEGQTLCATVSPE